MEPAVSEPIAGRLLESERIPPFVREHAGVTAAAVLALVAAPYLLLLKSPLRLAGDEISYLSIAARIAGGFPATFGADRGVDYPRGYPTLIAGLDRLGLGHPWAFIGVNLLFLAVGLAATYLLLRRVFGLGVVTTTVICGLVVLSRIVVWTAANALSDIPFFALAMLSLLLLVVSGDAAPRRAWVALGAAAVLIGVAIEFRTIGIALLPPWLWACATRPEVRRALRRARGHPLLAGTVAVVAVALLGAAVAFVVHSTGYLTVARKWWRIDDGFGAVAGQAAHELKRKLEMLGELAINVNLNRAPGFAALFVVAGLAVIVVVLLGVRARNRPVGVVEVYVGSVAAVLVLWPGNDARLWLPALPFLLAWGVFAVRSYRSVAVSAAAVAFVAVFCVIGAVTLGRSVSIGLSGSRFPEVWAETAPLTEPTYRLAFDPHAVVDRKHVRRRLLLLLRRYEARAQHPH